MAEHSCKLKIGGLIIRFTGVPLKAERFTLPFLVREGYEDPTADHTIIVSAADELKMPEYPEVYGDEHVHCFEAEDATYTARIRIRGNIPYAVSRDVRGEPVTELTLEQMTLDWDDWLRRVLLYCSLPHIMLERKRLMLHSSYIVTDRGGIVFCAPSGRGKSTQADLWSRYRNAEVINGDRSILCCSDDREEGVTAYSMPFCGTSGICRNRDSRLRAAVTIGWARESSAHPLRGVSAVRALLENSVVESWRRDENRKAAELAMDIASAVPVIRLDCRPDESAVEALEKTLDELGV